MNRQQTCLNTRPLHAKYDSNVNKIDAKNFVENIKHNKIPKET